MTKITMATAKKVLWEMYRTGKEAEEIIEEQQLGEITDIPTLGAIIDRVLMDNPKAVEDYKTYLRGG